MSGQLVGEIIGASDSLRARGLSERAFQAMIAIAEKANTQTRQGSVRWAHIQAAQYGRSLATAKRAVKELKDAGLVRVVKRGFNNQNGRSAAPVYELSTMPVRADIGRTPPDPIGSPIVTQSPESERITLDEPFGDPATEALGPNGSSHPTEWVKSATERVTQDDLLDGLTPDVTTSDKSALVRNRGTSPDADSSASTIAINEFAYRRADMSHQCPTCRAGPASLCRREDGEIRRTPCIARTPTMTAREATP